MAFVRERQIYTSTRKSEEMKEIEIFVVTEGQKRYYGSHRSRKKKAISTPKQKNLNDKNARIYFDRLANTNFGRTDYHCTTTYDRENYPHSVEEADAIVTKLFIPRLREEYRKRGLTLKYIWLTAFHSDKDGEPVRLHHHFLLSGGVERDVIENLWCGKSDKPGKLGEPLGWVNCDRLQANGDGISALCGYLARQPKEGRMRRWHSSLGLKKPMAAEPNDDKFDFSDLRKIVDDNADSPDVKWWERQYPGWTMQSDRNYAYTVSHSDITGASIRAKLRKLTKKELVERRKC